MKIKTWNIEEMTGYTPISTFYEDFSIADWFGTEAIEDTYKTAFKGWKNDYKMLTELSLALNWKSWEHAETDKEKSELYVKLWREVDEYCMQNLKGEELQYYYRTTD